MKKISVLIPCYNEEDNVKAISEAVINIFQKELPTYDYEIVFIDNRSQDKTRLYLRELCKNNTKIKAIFNTRNFGQSNSPYYGILQTTGDCTIGMACDFQDPVELIPTFVHEWENGYKIVIGIKKNSKESPFFHAFRSLYYKLLHRFSNTEQIEHYSGYSLYDADFLNVLRNIQDPLPYMRGMVSELGYEYKEVYYDQPKRRAGITHNNWYTLYDFAMLGFTSYTKIGLRMATFVGFFLSAISLLVAIVYFVYKLMHWYDFDAGIAPLVIGVFFMGAVELFFIGLIGEYILNINTRIMNRPLVVEEERINFDDTPPKQE